jgi:hypothetical protein
MDRKTGLFDEYLHHSNPEVPFDLMFSNYLICGHTHRRVIGEVVPGFMGVNVGSDYDDLKTFTIEV